MRICRFEHQGRPQIGFYDERRIVPIAAAGHALAAAGGPPVVSPPSDDVLDFLPHGAAHAAALRLADWLANAGASLPAAASLPTESVRLLVPVRRPNKIFLLAGNYAAHIEESGRDVARERAETFPYVFMKPPSTTLTDPGRAVRIPANSPSHIDWELELAVVIGKSCKLVSEAEALSYVAGYTIVNDVSNRKFRPNPARKQRPKDEFFDWLHGKWFDSFCPCGPCVTSAEAIPDPQKLAMRLTLNGGVEQDASTALQIFPVAAVIEFISSIVTLEPGDIISTGTPSGVGMAKNKYLKPGDRLEATIERIGTLVSPVE